MHSYSNGLQDLPDSVVLKSSLNPDDIVDKYKDALIFLLTDQIRKFMRNK